jgi:antitoxin (DNA-binding transcriptional repressor) of toxin-antitoxin stability system
MSKLQRRVPSPDADWLHRRENRRRAGSRLSWLWVQLKVTGMNTIINAKELRATLPTVVAKVRRGARFTVLYRSRPAFQVVPVDAPASSEAAIEEDSPYRAKALGRSTDRRSAADHDALLYRS